ncbi:hypothetical protein D9619_000025 [Psilocybe cf. subviscida]|uniref:Uncharacterized protein n=1 Tax=Psilocybe cf. subviscida TaxID=2480587 RepID=A0A8H5BCU2_9AGAR|nr:hypothetical protein D9619_000025 [Psilocybe cf. subviscida]
MSTLMSAYNAHLPRELYGEIIAYFNHRKDKQTLCDLALVSRALRAESQRVLFRRMTHKWPLHEYMDTNASKLRHKAFLLAIVSNPERLGPYVQVYAQVRHCYPLLEEDERLQAHPPLWRLTIEALPAMVNLKHLYVEPTPPMSAAVPTSISSWKFQLESLAWMALDDLTYLLRSQRSLQHLELGEGRMGEDGLKDLPDDICPALTSASGSICTLKHLGRNRRIEAFYAAEMSRADYKSFRRGNWMKDSFRLDVKLLEFRWWDWELQVLVLAVTLPPVTPAVQMPQEAIHEAVADSFRRLPTLNYVLINHPADSYILSHRYSRVESPTQELGAGENTQVGCQIILEVFPLDKVIGSVWWKIYTLFPSFVGM